ncbi:hypothetical protein EST38_g12727 [Candolleomyces aberdarensis]|uniref:Uncharacterized protein n=1 Tax=Candolleomyces aberdarensis TaxID=2316362 RepID=A0A4Q2D3R6_9AGAR|nr:hypothetical protein EST38_g12727 [Candolleomyces aberdarensis]
MTQSIQITISGAYDGGAGDEQVDYVGERHTQLVGLYFGKLRDIASKELKVGVSDIVIAVPGWHTDIQRRALLDAAAIANLNVLGLINDTTATALGYGITKTDLPDPESPRHVAFVDVGHATLSVSVAAFSKGQLTVLSTAYDQNLGGRDVDYALVQHFSNEFKGKYKSQGRLPPYRRLREAQESLVLQQRVRDQVESIMNDIDANSKLSREELEELIKPQLERITAPIHEAIAASGLTLDQIHSVELVGGSTRVPATKQKIQEAFSGKPLSTTLNQDEAAARGTTFACAMLSPVFRVREFHVHDINHYPIKVRWDASPTDPDDDTELLVFPAGNGLPSTKVLSFYRKEPFSITAEYATPDKLPGGINPWISNFTVKQVPPNPTGDSSCVKVRTRLNLHRIMSFESTYVEEVEEKEEPAPQPMEVDGAAPAADDAAPAPAPPKKKKVVKKKEVPFVATNSVGFSLLWSCIVAEVFVRSKRAKTIDSRISYGRMRYIQIKVWPPEVFEEGAEFIESLFKAYVDSHGQRLKVAFAETLLSLLPVRVDELSIEAEPEYGDDIGDTLPARGERIFGQPYSLPSSSILLTVGAIVVESAATRLFRRKFYEDNGFIRGSWFDIAEASFGLMLFVEFPIKIIADGCVFTPNAYLRSIWNVLDFVIKIGIIVNVTTGPIFVGDECVAAQRDLFPFYNLLVILTIFISIIIGNFSSRTGSAFLTRAQRERIDLQKLFKRQKPSQAFSNNELAERLRNSFFLVLMEFYILDVLVRLFGLRWRSFKANGWNLLDLAVAHGSFITLLIVQFGHSGFVINQLQKLFLVSIAFKFVLRTNSLNTLFKTAVSSLPVILSLLGLWLILFIFFGILEGWNQYMHDFDLTYPRCTNSSSTQNISDCGSTAWAFGLFVAWNILSMYIFVNIFTGAIVENFSYVFQAAGSGAKSTTREEMRSFKKVWAEFSNPKTGHLEGHRFTAFFNRLSGIFEVRIYPAEYLIPNIESLCKSSDPSSSSSPTITKSVSWSPRARIVDDIDLNKLDHVLDGVNLAEIRRRKAVYARLYHEATISHEPRVISFTNMLILLAHHKLIVDAEMLV